MIRRGGHVGEVYMWGKIQSQDLSLMRAAVPD